MILSNYSRKGEDPAAFAISIKPPNYYTGQQLAFLTPTWDMVIPYKNGNLSEKEYIKQYIQLLEHRTLTPRKVADALPDNCYLLCYEKPSDFCHRHIIAAWLNQLDDIRVSEWENEKDIKERQQAEVVDSLLKF